MAVRKHAAHVCLACSATITPDQEEVRVPGKGVVRYRHASDEDCRAALATPPRREFKAHKGNLPGLDAMEEWR